MKTCSFVGHSNLQSKSNTLRNKLRVLLRKEIRKMIEENDVTTFLNGGMGDFDELCAEVVHEMTFNRNDIQSYLINPYKTKNLESNQEHIKHLFTNSFIPKELENSDFNSAIPKRNRLMIDKSDFIISYVANNSGGASVSLDYATKKHKSKIINLADYIINKIDKPTLNFSNENPNIHDNELRKIIYDFKEELKVQRDFIKLTTDIFCKISDDILSKNESNSKFIYVQIISVIIIFMIVILQIVFFR